MDTTQNNTAYLQSYTTERLLKIMLNLFIQSVDWMRLSNRKRLKTISECFCMQIPAISYSNVGMVITRVFIYVQKMNTSTLEDQRKAHSMKKEELEVSTWPITVIWKSNLNWSPSMLFGDLYGLYHSVWFWFLTGVEWMIKWYSQTQLVYTVQKDVRTHITYALVMFVCVFMHWVAENFDISKEPVNLFWNISIKTFLSNYAIYGTSLFHLLKMEYFLRNNIQTNSSRRLSFFLRSNCWGHRWMNLRLRLVVLRVCRWASVGGRLQKLFCPVIFFFFYGKSVMIWRLFQGENLVMSHLFMR